MDHDKCRVMIGVGSLTPDKHGYKKYVGWGSISDSTAASVLYCSDLIEKWKSEVMRFKEEISQIFRPILWLRYVYT